MKVYITLDIPTETYSRITKWLKSYGAEGTLAEILQRDVENTVVKWKGRANAHFEAGGLNAFERFKAGLNMEDERCPK